MCILFLYVAKRPLKPSNGYKLILAANRDEYYSRPSRSARFWNTDPTILAGQDLESGGTWLGMNPQTGKIGVLLNIMGGTSPLRAGDKPKVSRGSLITNFLRSPSNLSGWTYCKNLNQDPSFDIWDFNHFSFLTIDLLPTSEPARNKNETPPCVTYFTNAPETKGTNQFPSIVNPVSSESEVFALGNSIISKPFLKVSNGSETFQRIVTKQMPKAELKTELLQFLKSTQKHFPDSQIELQGRHLPTTHLKSSSSSIYLQIPEVNYGTRTHTLILIDSENQVDFHEWTMEEPINPLQPNWIDSNFELKLQ